MPIKPDPSSDDVAPSPRRSRGLIGWVAIPTVIVLALFLAGVHVGARHPDLWLSRLMLWLLG
jgi:hypothetical protein